MEHRSKFNKVTKDILVWNDNESMRPSNDCPETGEVSVFYTLFYIWSTWQQECMRHGDIRRATVSEQKIKLGQIRIS